ncbi:glycosyltransferase family 9 protein [Oceanisphaera psychrotolerans]|nr:glycosyltransferase family 9 protein [Oceanisphaera psychrotolerans]
MLKKWISSLQLARDIWRRKLGLLLFDRPSPAFKLDKPLKRVVLVRWDAKWGDAIVSSFIFREWRRAYPNIKIDVITTPNMSNLFKKYFGADHVYEIKKRPSYSELKSLALEIGEADLLVHISKALKMKDLYFMNKVQARTISGLDDAVGLVGLKLGKLTEGKHFADKFGILLEQTGVDIKDSSYIVPDDEASQNGVDDFLSSIEGPILAFNPYGSGKSRQLSKEKIKKIIGKVAEIRNDVSVVILTTPDKKDEVADICEFYDQAFYYPESNSIYDSISIMRRAAWVISVDTATVHIAIGLNKPLLALYNPDDENFIEWGPNASLAISIFASEVNPPDINSIDGDLLSEHIYKLLNVK